MGFLDLPLVKLILSQPVSALLRSRITEVSSIGNIPFETVGKYIEAGASAIDEMTSSLGMNEELAYELHDLISQLKKKVYSEGLTTSSEKFQLNEPPKDKLSLPLFPLVFHHFYLYLLQKVLLFARLNSILYLQSFYFTPA